MRPVIMHKYAPDSRSEWLKYRNTLFHGPYLGGSEAPVVMGLIQQKSPALLMAEKLEMVEKEDVGRITRVRLGIQLEDFVARETARELGLRIRRCNRIHQSSSNSFMVASVDREIVGSKAGMEIKTASAPGVVKRYGDSGTGKVPESVYAQCQHYMAVMGWEWMVVGVFLMPLPETRHYIIPSDEEFQHKLVQKEERFINLFKEGRLPHLDGTDGSTELVRRNGKACIEGMLDAKEHHRMLAKKLVQFDTAVKKLEQRKKALENRLKFEIGEAEGIEGICSWREYQRECLDNKLFRKEHPELFSRYKKQSTQRRFKLLE
ncbi:MAG: YqaJ viral recombinase family protein [SAR324 cluster bacterium]|nr:YqaJ viral recombinase family protein [SAR324 cluster bacterium]